jgi:uncharacterized cupin superfamily protein
MAQNHPLLHAAEIARMPEEIRPHPLDATRVRHTRSLGDTVGLSTMGVHLVRLECGDTSSVQHFHHQDEEWVYVLSGRGIAEIGDERLEVGPGDFMGFVAGSAAHCLHNPHAEDLVYLVGGNRWPFDICDYPQIGKRRYRVNGKSVFVDGGILERAGEKIPGARGKTAG